MLKRLSGVASALAVAALFLTAPPAKADTYNLQINTMDQTNGFDFNFDITTNGSNVVTGLTGSITGLGSFGIDSGTVTGFLAAPGNGNWNIDNVFNPTSPYFSATPTSGIVANFTLNSDNSTTSGVNLYNDTTGNDFASFNPIPNGEFIPGLQLNLAESSVTDLSATPLPATLPLFAGGLGLVGFLTRRKKKAAQDVNASALAAA